MPENDKKDFQSFDYRIDNVNDRVNHTNRRIDDNFQQLTNELRQSRNNLSRQIQGTNNQINRLSDKISGGLALLYSINYNLFGRSDLGGFFCKKKSLKSDSDFAT